MNISVLVHRYHCLVGTPIVALSYMQAIGYGHTIEDSMHRNNALSQGTVV